MAMAWRRLLTLPALPPGPLSNSPCLNSCMTRPRVFRCRGDDVGMANLAVHFRCLLEKRLSTLSVPGPVASTSRAGALFAFRTCAAACADVLLTAFLQDALRDEQGDATRTGFFGVAAQPAAPSRAIAPKLKAPPLISRIARACRA